MEKQPLLSIKLASDDFVDKAAQLVIKVKDSLNKLLDCPDLVNAEESEQPSELLSIYKIPHFMKEIDPKPFEPMLMSFGPYHHGKQHLLPMEPEKQRAFRSFKTNYGLEVEFIVTSVCSILKDLWGSYDKLEKEWTEKRDKFLQLMIVDGCFMLEFLNECPTSLSNMSGNINRDMLLLENQLPMKLLDKLYSIAEQNQPLSKDLRTLVCDSLCIFTLGQTMTQFHHILDVYRASLLDPPIDWQERRSCYQPIHYPRDPDSTIIRSATQLREAGIKFEISKTNSLMDVWFDPKRGVLRLPQLLVDDGTESIFLNAMAFETLMPKSGNQVASFVFIFGNLIQEVEDVALLSSARILSNVLETYTAVTLFRILTKRMVISSMSPFTMWTVAIVNAHCDRPWTLWWASLKDPRTQKPWVVVSIAAASFGFLLQIIQTVYGVYGYHRPIHS